MGHQSEREITAVLAEHGPASGPELAKLLDTHPATVERRCRKLQQRGEIRQVTGGRYAIVESGHVRQRTASD
jgi:predicted ArsR family transcriptional regulator